MTMRSIEVHKMFAEFQVFPRIIYMGEYDENNELIHLYNKYKESLKLIPNTHQWRLNSTGDIYFTSQDPMIEDTQPFRP